MAHNSQLFFSKDYPKRKLRECASKIGSGFTPTGGSKQYCSKKKTTFIRSQNVYNEGFSHTGLAFINDGSAALLKEVSLQENDVLINITGDSVARCCLAPANIIPGRVSQHVMIIRPIPQLINSHFLRYFLISPAIQRHLLNLASATSTRSALTKSIIEDLSIPNLPLEEQNKIADVL